MNKLDAGTGLLPCPFCGAHLVEAEAFRTRSRQCFVHPLSSVEIYTYCPASDVRIFIPDDERVAAWNRRAAASGDGPFQARVEPWMRECFGDVIPFDKVERGDRLIEEVFELLQSGGYDPARVLALRDYVWGRPVGEPAQEVGGVMVTLAAYCLAFSLDMHEAGETELARIWTKVDLIRAKQAAKPTGSALPIATASPLGGPSLALEAPKSLPTLPVEREAYPIPLGYVLETTERWSRALAALAALAALQASEARIAEVERERDACADAAVERSLLLHSAEARLAKVVEAARPIVQRCAEAVHPDDADGSGLTVKVGQLRALSQVLSELEGK